MYLTNGNFVVWSLTLIIGTPLILFCIKVIPKLKSFIEGGVRKMKKNEKGFTLIELIIIVAVIGVLATIAITQFSKYRERGYDTISISLLREAALKQEAYYVDNLAYAPEDILETLLAIPENVDLDVALIDEGYSMSAKHDSSRNRYEILGPGGSISRRAP